MEQIRTRFLEKQLGLPGDVISIIRGYDPIYRDYYSKKIVKNINKNVVDFWEKKCMEYTKKQPYHLGEDYIKQIQKYYTTLFVIVPIDIDYNDENTGLLMFD